MKTIKIKHKEITVEAMVDDDDYDMLISILWYVEKTDSGYYIKHSYWKGHTVIPMADFIMDEVGSASIIDHIDRNPLNNQKSNLRVVTHQENCFNRIHKNFKGEPVSSEYKGVGWHKNSNKWRVRVKKDGKSISLGYFIDEKEAALAYDKKAKELFGSFAYLNFP